MKLGFAPIDDEHERLLSTIAEVEALLTHKPSTETARKAIGGLTDMTLAHFCSEEQWMERYCYPGLVVHKREHAEIMAWLVHLQEQLVKDISESLSDWTRSDTIDLFRAWVVQHLQQLDAPALNFIVDAQAAEAAVTVDRPCRSDVVHLQ